MVINFGTLRADRSIYQSIRLLKNIVSATRLDIGHNFEDNSDDWNSSKNSIF
ncbi:MAG: hypothetical protein ACI9XO_001322 [Paraglaciecola sp.]|jgi:hypothetical protein